MALKFEAVRLHLSTMYSMVAVTFAAATTEITLVLTANVSDGIVGGEQPGE